MRGYRDTAKKGFVESWIAPGETPATCGIFTSRVLAWATFLTRAFAGMGTAREKESKRAAAWRSSCSSLGSPHVCGESKYGSKNQAVVGPKLPSAKALRPPCRIQWSPASARSPRSATCRHRAKGCIPWIEFSSCPAGEASHRPGNRPDTHGSPPCSPERKHASCPTVVRRRLAKGRVRIVRETARTTNPTNISAMPLGSGTAASAARGPWP